MNSKIAVFMFFSLTLSWMHMEQWNLHYFLLYWTIFSSHYYQQSTRFSLPKIQVCHIRAVSSNNKKFSRILIYFGILIIIIMLYIILFSLKIIPVF